VRAIYVPLSEPIRRALNDLAEREYRDPRDQATMMLADALRKAGALPEDRSAALTTVTREPEALARRSATIRPQRTTPAPPCRPKPETRVPRSVVMAIVQPRPTAGHRNTRYSVPDQPSGPIRPPRAPFTERGLGSHRWARPRGRR